MIGGKIKKNYRGLIKYNKTVKKKKKQKKIRNKKTST
jgi:hypothetical protein